MIKKICNNMDCARLLTICTWALFSVLFGVAYAMFWIGVIASIMFVYDFIREIVRPEVKDDTKSVY